MSESAFPQLSVESGQRDGHGDLIEPFTAIQGGLTKREWYAGMALQGHLSNPYAMEVLNEYVDKEKMEKVVAKACFEFADAMLKEGGGMK